MLKQVKQPEFVFANYWQSANDGQVFASIFLDEQEARDEVNDEYYTPEGAFYMYTITTELKVNGGLHVSLDELTNGLSADPYYEKRLNAQETRMAAE